MENDDLFAPPSEQELKGSEEALFAAPTDAELKGEIAKDVGGLDAAQVGFIDFATFGHYPEVAGAVGSLFSDLPQEKLEELYRLKQQAAEENWPKSVLAGKIATAVGGAASLIPKAGKAALRRSAAEAGKKGLKTAVETSKKAARAVPQSVKDRVKKAAEMGVDVVSTKTTGVPVVKAYKTGKKILEALKKQKTKTPTVKPKYRIKDGKLVKVDE